MPIKEIFLEDAIRTINCTKLFMWFTSGEIIENKTLKSGDVCRIGVTHFKDKSEYSVTQAIHKADGNFAIFDLGNFSSLDELRNQFPQIFEVTGNLYVH